VNLPLPTRQSRDLIRIDEFTGMAEVSYAAAWELGRLLALKSPVIGIGLNQWKRQVAHAGHRAVHADLLDELDQQIPSSPVLPPQIAAWFENALGRLASLPFDYLIPDPELLPPETMAWFSLDRAWMAALYDGAFSIGRGSNRQLDADRQLAHALPKVGTRSGFIVRSRAVSGWTDLLVDGYRTQAGQSPLLEPIRHERIGRDTLLVLYAGPIDAVSIHLHPQALHFGFDGSAESGFQKDGRPVKLSEPGRVVDLAELAASLGVTGAHDFTLEMIEPTASISHRFTVPHD